jgi:3',5'-cyclic AMP phosphodiesterase CpdA
LVRLAHCSDLHLLSHDGARWIELANKRWIGAMNLLANRSRHHHVAAFEQMVDDLNALRVEHVLCTGDLTNLAMRREFEFARARFDKLAGGPAQVTVIPGNHDAYVAEGIEHFAALFADYASSDPGWPSGWPIVRVRGELALIGVTTSRATPWFTAYGNVGDDQLARLRAILVDERLRGKVRVVAIHHPPAGQRAASRIRGLHDHAAFAEVIAACGAELVLHGHEHKCLVEQLMGPAGPVPVRGVASGTYLHKDATRSARYRIYEIRSGKLAGDHVRIWNRDAACFEPGATGP